ncbi:hypothetical protein ACXYTJ_15500 [Gilvimarinus sp. F26214L]|uniref:hypothetical protein n=1 Tax=Gilvimarinus sp. DZF01 TaxID=3461371 RepID=UPI00404604BD
MKEPHWIYAEINKLEEQLEDYWSTARNHVHYTVRNGKVRFDRAVRIAQRRYKVHLLSYIARAKPLHVITAPVIYGMVIPIALFDLFLNLYQQICFRAYGIPRVRRADYMVLDRHQLSYLNGLEKLNCLYCSYGNGMVAFAREVLARTEQYWCPIKHAKRVKGAHNRYRKFVEYGDAKAYREQLPKLRRDFEDKGAGRIAVEELD